MSCQAIVDIPVNVITDELKHEHREEQLHRQHFAFRNVITRDEAVKLTQCVFSPAAELIDYYLRPYSEEKIGFLGCHLSLVLTAKRPGQSECEKRNFFVKTLPLDVPTQANYVQEKGVFKKETCFFKYLVPLLLEDYKGDSWVPDCYLTKDNTIVFEDMKCKGFYTKPRMLDEEAVKSAVACIARFHACSLLAEERLNGKPLNVLYPSIFEESEYKRTNRNYTWFQTAINLATSVAAELGLPFDHILAASERVFDLGQPSKTKRNVIGHGDLWSNNLLFNDTNQCNLVDFQLLRYAPLAHDVIQLLYLTTTRDYRENNELRLVEHYYATLKKSLVLNNFQGLMPSYEEVLLGVEEQRFPALVNAAINYPTMMMDGKIGAKVLSDLDSYNAYFLRDRRPFVNQIMTLDSEYARKVKDIVRELAEVSLKVDDFPRPS